MGGIGDVGGAAGAVDLGAAELLVDGVEHTVELALLLGGGVGEELELAVVGGEVPRGDADQADGLEGRAGPLVEQVASAARGCGGG